MIFTKRVFIVHPQTLLHDVKDDDLEPEEILGMLNGASEPSPSSTINKYSFANGYRLIDMKLLTTALQSSQKCPHGQSLLFTQISSTFFLHLKSKFLSLKRSVRQSFLHICDCLKYYRKTFGLSSVRTIRPPPWSNLSYFNVSD